MGQEIALRVDMQQLNDVFVANDTTATGLRESLGRDDLPVVVRVIVGVSGDLLA